MNKLQILTAEEIYIRMRNAIMEGAMSSRNYSGKQFIPLSLVEATLKQILEEIDKVCNHFAFSDKKTMIDISWNEIESELNQIITKSFKKIGIKNE